MTPLETLQQIAALAKTLPTSNYIDVGLGCTNRAAADLLVDLGGERRRQVSLQQGVIESGRLVVDGVTFSAQWSRPATAEELALLDSPEATHRTELVIASLKVRP